MNNLNATGQIIEAPDAPGSVDDEVAVEVIDALDKERNAQLELAEEYVDAIEKKMSKAYIKEHQCPVCKSPNVIDRDGIDPMDYDHAYAKCYCDDCGATWSEEWVLRAIYGIELGARS